MLHNHPLEWAYSINIILKNVHTYITYVCEDTNRLFVIEMGANHSKKDSIRTMCVTPEIATGPESKGPIIMPAAPTMNFYLKHGLVFEPILSYNEDDERDRIPSALRNYVWVKYHGENSLGQCYCCGVVIQRYNGGWHSSHVEAKGGDSSPENMRTCCQHCNLSMEDQNLYAYIRDKGLTGPGAKNVKSYFTSHPSPGPISYHRDNKR